MLRDIGFGHVLFHEIGHHIHNTVRPEYDEKEDVADKWDGEQTETSIPARSEKLMMPARFGESAANFTAIVRQSSR